MCLQNLTVKKLKKNIRFSLHINPTFLEHIYRNMGIFLIMFIVYFRLTAFVAKTLQEARFGEWEKDMFIPIELLNKIAIYLCSQQNNVTGAFEEHEFTPIYDRTYVSFFLNNEGIMYTILCLEMQGWIQKFI